MLSASVDSMTNAPHPEESLTRRLPQEAHYQPLRPVGYRPSEIATLGLLVLIVSLSWWLSQSLLILVLSILVFALASTAHAYWRQRHARRQNRLAEALLEAGRLEEASLGFEELCLNYLAHPMHPIFVMNRGVTILWSGEAERAMELFNSASESMKLSPIRFGSFRRNVKLHRALVLTLLGQDGDAEEILKTVKPIHRARVENVLESPKAHDGLPEKTCELWLRRTSKNEEQPD
jgi:hypothetical protein